MQDAESISAAIQKAALMSFVPHYLDKNRPGVSQSRASTAGIGVLFLPGAGALTGLLAVAFARMRQHPQPLIRVGAWLCLAASLSLPVSSVVSTFQMRARYRDADRDYAAALGTAFVSEERLDQLSANNHLLMMIARNTRTRPDTLEARLCVTP
jgi:hypothetical protein